MKPNSTSTVADKVPALMLRHGQHCCCFAAASLPPIWLLFDCLWIREVVSFNSFSVERIGAGCRRSDKPEMT